MKLNRFNFENDEDEKEDNNINEEGEEQEEIEEEENLQESQKLNFMRWPIMNEKVHENPDVWGSYAAEVQNVRRYIIERLLWMDNKLGYTYNPSGIINATIDFDQPYQIYDLSGRSYTGNVQHLPQGMYIVKQGNHTKKIQVR